VQITSDDSAVVAPAQVRSFALSPKRNSQRQSFEQIVAQLRSQNKTFPAFLAEAGNRQINDTTFDNYPSLGEAIYFYYQDAIRSGGNQIEGMDAVVGEFNSILGRVFPNYEIIASWNNDSGAPDLTVQFPGPQPLRFEWLSVGQREVLALLFNMYATRNDYHIYLIDEPEIHLNWSLERSLFNFFEYFCETYDKQVIVATHSRVAFEAPFLTKTQFLVWDGPLIASTSSLTQVQRAALGGEIAATVLAAAPIEKTFCVEDERLALVVGALINARGTQATTFACGNSWAVRSLYEFARTQPGWSEYAFFVEDGDNQNSPFPGDSQFIHLDRYCIECYLFDLRVVKKSDQ
jgi:hypothetical protein